MAYEDEKRDQETRLVYQIYIEDIRHAKNQLWFIIGSGLSLQAALYALFKNYSFLTINKYFIIWFATGLLMLLLFIYWLLLDRYRSKKKDIIESFSKEVKKLLNEDKSSFYKILGKYADSIFFIVFEIVLFVVACLIHNAI